MSDTSRSASPSSALRALSSALAELVRLAEPSVVSIEGRRSRSSGFVWRSGLIVAAENALADEGEIRIVAHGGGATAAEVVGRDPSSDVALLRVQGLDLPQAPRSARAAVTGALAIVIGARDGASAASLGVVSFSGPQWRSLRGGLIDARIELDAELRRTSEGGLALDADGHLLGMAVFGPRQRTLVIPSATVDRVAEVLVEKGRVARGYLGLGLHPVRLEGNGSGLMAMSVDPKGPGAAAGVRQGDVIVTWNGETIRGLRHLLRALGPDSVGTSVKLSLKRAGEPTDVILVVAERP
jgi:S1-C subfamily serine protease